ncbi:hypothetical protein glysoja_047061 [Glycine soja]|uniref:Uncharacterized protein n=1 Tax=Glycine soja TaxID=3848 RepID=A0A0B2RAP4_GLYSO|nr:hypothetical protein glysoja_047061 [Glycine soja]
MGASVGVAQYGKDLIKLILSTLYESSKFKPSLVAPGGFYEKYCALLWHRLMGKKVLAVSSDVHIKDFYLQLGNVSRS